MDALGGFGVFIFVVLVLVIIIKSLGNDNEDDEKMVKAATDFKSLFGVNHKTSLAQDLINTAYRAVQDELSGLKDKNTDDLDLKQLSQHSVEIDALEEKLKGLETMARALGFTVPA